MTLMIADPPTSGMRLGVGFDSRSRTRGEAWRNAIGTKPVPARFALLPEGEKRWDRVGVSAVLQIAILTFFVVMPIFFPERLEALKYSVVPLLMPVTEVPVAPPPPPPPKVKAVKAPEPKPIEEPKLSPKQPHIFVQQKVFQPQIKQVDVKAPELSKETDFEAKLNTPINAPKKKAVASDSPTTMVDILDKPRPQYTAEGRSLRLEGDVVLDMVFLANGTVQVNRVISGLGHGLDEAATRAAQQIKFKPAKREGQPVDFPARVRIEFRLAY